MILNGNSLVFAPSNPIIKNGTILCPCGNCEIVGGQVNWDGATKTVEIDNPTLIASIPHIPFECGKELVKVFILESNGQRKYFDWINTTNLTRNSQLECLMSTMTKKRISCYFN